MAEIYFSRNYGYGSHQYNMGMQSISDKRRLTKGEPMAQQLWALKQNIKS